MQMFNLASDKSQKNKTMEKFTLVWKIALNAGLILVVILAGVMLHRAGKPWNGWWFNLHKLATLAMVFFLFNFLRQYIRSFGIPGFQWFILATGGLAILILLVSGGFLSLYKIESLMLRIHRTAIFVFVLCTIAEIFLLLKQSLKILS
jgi:hypothetical protein